MIRNTYTLDGIPLMDPEGRWFFERSTGLRLIPAKSMPNISYPGVDGEAFSPGATYLPGGVRIVMYTDGKDHEEFMTRVEYLNALFLQRHKLLELRHDYDEDGLNSRHAWVRFSASTSIEPIGQGMKSGTIEYIAEIPGVFWRSVDTRTMAMNTITTTPKTYSVGILAGGNAPVIDSLIRFKGGFSTLTMVDLTTGSQIVCNTPLTSSEYIIVDTLNWTARKVTTNTWDGGTNVDMSVVSNRGSGSMFNMEPSLLGQDFQYQVTLSCTNPSGNPQVEIRAKKAYL